jgi:hypothetical protein
MRLIPIVILVCITSLARAQETIEVPNAPPAPPPPSLAFAPQAPVTDLRVVVQAIERSDRHARNRALIAAGSVLLGSGYAAALTLGALTLNSSDGCGASILNASSATLMVPVLGPFISSPLSGSLAWALPVALVDGVAQVAGLALIIHGARSEQRLALTPILGANSLGLGISGRL